ncbi:pectin esterase [Lacimicrobium alkaliphilum]|uniref:Pectin esterase n=1 Tax=Lacimicrobium alkaliphilum TaxID=1526571 RepID=A0A0U3ANB0_9ALTE|nr:pectin esterase [Lacimicrobium alkaliphilum]
MNNALQRVKALPTGAVIYIAAGDYYERLQVTTDNLKIVGAGQQQTRIYYDRYAGQPVPGESQQTWGTFRTATVNIEAKDVIIANLTIENSFDYPANEALPEDHPDKVRGEQAVALYIGDNADRTQLEQVSLKGYQDTLYVKGKRSYIVNSRISGHIDFIFGHGSALITHSDIISRARHKPGNFSGYITAPSTLIDQPYGLTFRDCRLLAEEGVGQGSVALGRPWHPTTTFADGRYANPDAIGKTVFIQTYMGEHIAAEGWTSMGGTAKDGSRKLFTPADARFFESQSHGPGAAVNGSRAQLTSAQASEYAPDKVLGNWRPRLLMATSD